ncbi:YciI family protein [Demequina muriae]|uniref:YciI family protein n=1 Tax=Demequina muriae TaxID=3051664 RepID=A0ABT8GH91_9MICO|nr:YciI family protein [Demequina sp. EGI L300058]MDN4480636.1 YciI family protein [Demequina sp. EGI L300058]
MQFLMLVLVEEVGADAPEGEGTPIDEWGDRYVSAGVNLMGSRLRPATQARTVRQRRGGLVVTDGPFAETHEAIGGFDVLECGSWDEAITVASEHPMAYAGAIELREFWPFDQE